MASSSPQVRLRGGAESRFSLFPDEAFTIGSAHGNGLRLAHAEVAELHCELLWANGEVTITDFAGATLRNGQLVGLVQVMADGDVLTVGPFELEFSWMRPAAAPPRQRDPWASGLDETPSSLARREAEPTFVIRQVLYQGEEVHAAPLKDGLRIGTSPDCEVFLPELSGDFARQQSLLVTVEQTASGFVVQAPGGQEGVFLNSRFFKEHELVIGDYLQLGSYHFRFDGLALVAVGGSMGGAIEGRDLHVTRGKNHILRGAHFAAKPGQFIGILGPSGAGKTTLLNALSGLAPVGEGQVLLNGVDVRENPAASRSLLGYVPQDDIVHLELTVRQALDYSARLRLPDATPRHEIDKLVEKTAGQLGLDALLDRPVAALSGGQRKRVSVGVELLNRPQILFLDEPTSGLDPGTEFQLMKLLRGLTSTGCTVICTTHLMENVYLMDAVTVVQDGLTVFHGDSAQARDHFGIGKLSQLYERLAQRPAEEWAREALLISGGPEAEVGATPATKRRNPLRSLVTLLSRQTAILAADAKNYLLLLGQPLLIGLLIALVAVSKNASEKMLSLSYIAALWFGCSNSAQEIVRERSVFRREKFVGLSPHAYLLSKFAGMSLITCVQALLLWGMIQLPLYGHALKGSAAWQVACLLAVSVAATGIGLAISAWAKKPTQAILFVPLVIIPQILFAGFVFPVSDWDGERPSWNGQPFVRVLARATPSFSAERLMNTSVLWNREIGEEGTAFAQGNLKTALRPASTWLAKKPTNFTYDETAVYAVPEGSDRKLEKSAKFEAKLGPEEDNLRAWPDLETQLIYRHASPALLSLLSLAVWAALSYVLAAIFLARE